MSNHTPGPWRVEEDTTVIWGKCDPEDRTTWGMGYPIAQMHTAVNNPQNIGPDMDEALSNAHLIARAPEMAAEIERLTARVEELEAALKDLVCLIDEDQEEDAPPYLVDQVLDRARAAIAKAEKEVA